MKHDVRSCGCNFTKCTLQIGREKHWFQSQFQIASEFYKFCQAGDIFHFEGASYLLILDYTSHYPLVCKLTSMTGQQVASQFKLICSEYGWPETIVSDNGQCYTSEIFTYLMSEYNINHITSSPHYPQSNGLAEKYVQIVKNLFYKAK